MDWLVRNCETVTEQKLGVRWISRYNYSKSERSLGYEYLSRFRRAGREENQFRVWSCAQVRIDLGEVNVFEVSLGEEERKPKQKQITGSSGLRGLGPGFSMLTTCTCTCTAANFSEDLSRTARCQVQKRRYIQPYVLYNTRSVKVPVGARPSSQGHVHWRTAPLLL